MRNRARSRSRRGSALALLLGGCALALASCSGSGGTGQAGTGGTGAAAPLLSVSTSKRTVGLTLLAASSSGSSQYNFDGASNGSMTVRVPVGWKVEVTCRNESTYLTHSCAIVRPGSTTPAFAGSAIERASEGLQPGLGAAFSFVAGAVGQYQIVCLVPGHREQGMWDRFVVTSGGRPSIVGAHTG